MRITPLILLSLLPAAAAGKHKRAKTHKRKKKIDHKLIHTKSLEPWSWQSAWGDSITRAFGPKQKGQLCNTLTSSVVLFDVDASGGLDWAEFQSFNMAIVDAAKDGKRKLQKDPGDDILDKVYHDMTCECHYTFGNPLECCHEEKPGSEKPQVTFQGLATKGEDRTEEDKAYRRHFCDGIMYLLESEGVTMDNANDAIVTGLNVDIVDFDIVDGGSIVGPTVTTTLIAIGDGDASSAAAPESTAAPMTEVEHTVEETIEEVVEEIEATEESVTEATVTQSITTTPISSTIETSKQIDASTSSVMTASTTEGNNDSNSNNSSVAAGATIGILFAALAALLALAMTVIHRKREEKRRLAEFAGEEFMDDDLEANSVNNDVVAIETMGGEKVYAELTPEAYETEVDVSEENNDNDDDNSDVMSVVSLSEQKECAQISFEEDKDGGVEAKVTVGSTLAAMGVASTVTSRLSTQQQKTDV
ncbi:hypothetical protein ACHAXN_003245 [Cyclotella atomus]